MSTIPGGLIAEKLGGKWVASSGVLVAALLTLSYPWVAGASTTLFIVLRSFQGFLEGAVAPAYYNMAAKWFPPTEKGFLMTFVVCGPELSSIFSS